MTKNERQMLLEEADNAEAQAGMWIQTPPNLKHSIKARTLVVMLLTLMKK